MHVLLMSVGTEGDVRPFVGLGLTLRDRGHCVTLLANEYFERLASNSGLRFVPIGKADDYRRALQNPDVWGKLKGAKAFARAVCDCMPEQYRHIAELYKPGQTVVVASGAALGARIARERLGIPLATIVLQPAILRTAYAMPVVPGVPPVLDWIPPFGKRLLFRLADVLVDRLLCTSEVNTFRGKLGLPPVKRLMHTWWLSPDRVIAMFPSWYGAPQPDWPKQIRLSGFPMYDESAGSSVLSAEVECFLDQAGPPIVFTPGTGMTHGREFFQTAARACQLLGRRGMLLTLHADQVPARLPASVRHFDFVPFSLLLPRVAAIVHHGGIGTLIQAMAAGIPQLVMPTTGDQPDNARRLERLGVGDWLRPKAFRPRSVARKLEYLLTSPDVAHRCKALARRFDGPSGLSTACELIEALIAREAPRASAREPVGCQGDG